ncbi:MAG: hypothetical protein PHF24_07055 [Syntrophomonas sp.]|nr:hypothetical protein [Syntrophomonas sp.]
MDIMVIVPVVILGYWIYWILTMIIKLQQPKLKKPYKDNNMLNEAGSETYPDEPQHNEINFSSSEAIQWKTQREIIRRKARG